MVWWSFPQGGEELFIDFMEGECRYIIDGLHDKGCSMDVINRDFCGAGFKGFHGEEVQEITY